MFPSAESASGRVLFFGGQVLPGKVLPGPRIYNDEITHAYLPRALPAGIIPRMGGRLFLSPSYARWALPRKSAVAECYTVSAGAEFPSRSVVNA